MTAKELFTETDYATLTRQQRARILKMERAKEESGLRKVSSVLCDVVFNMLPDEICSEMNYREISTIAKLVLKAYLTGVKQTKYSLGRSLYTAEA